MKHFTTARYGLSIHTSRPRRGLRASLLAAAWGAVLAFAVYALLAAFSVAHADGQYDPRLTAQRDEVLRVYARTEWCMHDAAKAGLTVGMRRNAQIEEFALKMCGSKLTILLTSTPPQWSPSDVSTLLRGMAVQAVARQRGAGML